MILNIYLVSLWLASICFFRLRMSQNRLRLSCWIHGKGLGKEMGNVTGKGFKEREEWKGRWGRDVETCCVVQGGYRRVADVCGSRCCCWAVCSRCWVIYVVLSSLWRGVAHWRTLPGVHVDDWWIELKRRWRSVLYSYRRARRQSVNKRTDKQTNVIVWTYAFF